MNRVKRAVALLAILLLAAALRVPTIATKSLWTDEGLSLYIAKLAPAELLKRVIEWEQIPPVHHLLLHFWMKVFGDSETSLRMPSAIAGIASVAMLYLLVRRLMGHRIALLAALVLAVMPMHIAYSQEARTYALHILLGLISCDLFVRQLRTPTQKLHAAYVFASALFFYTHIFAVFTLLAQHFAYAIMLWRWRGSGQALPLRLREWIIDNLALAALISPWAPIVLRWTKQVQTNFWVKEVTFDSISEAYWMFSGSTAVLIAMAVLVVVAIVRWRRRSGFLVLLALLIVPVVVPVGISVLTRPSFAPRYAMPAMVALAAVAAAGLAALRPAPLRWAAILALVVVMPFGRAADFPKPPWREVGKFLNDNMGQGDLAVVHLRAGTRLYDYYVHRPDVRRLGFDSPNMPMSYPLDPPGRRAWLIVHDHLYPANRMIERAPVRIGRRKITPGIFVMELIEQPTTAPDDAPAP